VKGLPLRLVHTDLEFFAQFGGPVEKLLQCALLRDSEVVSGQQANATAAIQKSFEAGLDRFQAGNHDEGDEQVSASIGSETLKSVS
jgi:hypothetical protein